GDVVGRARTSLEGSCRRPRHHNALAGRRSPAMNRLAGRVRAHRLRVPLVRSILAAFEKSRTRDPGESPAAGTGGEMAHRVMDLTGRGERATLQITAGTAIELLVGLCAFGLPEDHGSLESGPDWFEKARTRASTDLLEAYGRV